MKKLLAIASFFCSLCAAANLLSIQVPTAPAAFTANSISGLIGWYDATVGVTGSSPVTAWADQKASNNLACANSPTLNATGFNGHPTINFNGGTAKCTVTTAGNQSPVAVFMVIEPLSGNVNFSNLFSGTNTATTGSLTFEVGGGANTINVWRAGTGLYAASGAGSFATNGTYMAGFTYDGSTTVTTYLGSSQSGQSTGTASGNFLGGTWIVGSTPSGFSAVVANISEIAVYSAVPSAGNITSLHTAWVSKWGVN